MNFINHRFELVSRLESLTLTPRNKHKKQTIQAAKRATTVAKPVHPDFRYHPTSPTLRYLSLNNLKTELCNLTNDCDSLPIVLRRKDWVPVADLVEQILVGVAVDHLCGRRRVEVALSVVAFQVGVFEALRVVHTRVEREVARVEVVHTV